MEAPIPVPIDTIIQCICEATLEQLQNVAGNLIPVELMPSATFIDALSAHKKTEVLKACLIIFVLSCSGKVPRQFQLIVSLATLAGRDSMITSATGSSKTLCILIPMLLQPDKIFILISPLKCLQAGQVCSRTLFGMRGWLTKYLCIV
jgi:hypothetical protein